MSNKKGISIEKDCLNFIPFWFLYLASFDVFKALKHNLMRHEFQVFWFLPYKLTFYCKTFTKEFKKYSKNVAFSDDLEPFEFKHFPRPLAPIIVVPARCVFLSPLTLEIVALPLYYVIACCFLRLLSFPSAVLAIWPQ